MSPSVQSCTRAAVLCRKVTYGRWSKSSTVPLGLTVTLLTSLCSPSRRKRRNSWASCWLQDRKNQSKPQIPGDVTVFRCRYKTSLMQSYFYQKKMYSSLLVSHKSGSISLDLSFELRRADRLTAGQRPHGLYQLGKFCQKTNTRVTHTGT